MLDDLDRKLIALLRDDARSSIAMLAKKLGVARGTVQNRIARLEKDGTISRITLLDGVSLSETNLLLTNYKY
jgi:DNA-binding Lrp family transcriptional regulator